MKDLGKMMARWTLVMSSLVLVIPFQGIHHLFEHHEDDVHVCDFDVCIRKELVDCDLCEFVKTNSKSIFSKDGYCFNVQIQTNVLTPCCKVYENKIENRHNKGPPVKNDTSTT